MHGSSGVTNRERASAAIEAAPTWGIVAAIIALHVLLSAWQTWYVQINNDGILYVQAARLLMEGRAAEASAIYHWYYFPLLISAISKVTTLDPLIVGKIVNLLASTVTVGLLLRISWMELPSKATLVAVAVLLLGNYAWNDARSALTRDQMFFCFVVLSFVFLLHDRRTPRLSFKIGFAAACLCASLFRKEAAGLLVLVPAFMLAFDGTRRWTRLAAILVLAIVIPVVVLAVPYELNGRSAANMFARTLDRIAIMRDQVLWPYASHRANLGYASLVIGIIVASTISSLSPLSMALTGWGLVKSAAFRTRDSVRLFACYFAASMIALCTQTFFVLVFESRYGLFLGLLLSVPAAIAATTLIPPAALRDRRALLPTLLVAAWLIYGLIGGLKVSDASRFQLDAGDWLKSHVAPDAVSLSNNNQIAFYGNLAFKDADADFFLRSVLGREDISTLRDFSKYDVVVIRLRQNQLDQVPRLDAVIGKKPSVAFENSRGDKILIYEPRKPAR